MRREVRASTLAVTANIATTAKWSNGPFAGTRLKIPAGSGLTSLKFYDVDENGVATEVYEPDPAGAPGAMRECVITVSAGKTFPVPDACFACPWVAMVGNTSGTVYARHKT